MTSAFIFVAVLLLVGVALRIRLSIFHRLFIPASVIAGIVGLILLQLTRLANNAGEISAIEQWAEPLHAWPGWLIAVVFAGMLLERKPAPWKESLSRVGRQGLMVWVIVLGQTAVGLLVTWLFIQPLYDVPNSTAMLIETGFAGGHGTAAAMGQVFANPSIRLESGLDLGILMATCGLVYGVVSGIFWINLAARIGWIEVAQLRELPLDNGAQSKIAIGYACVGKETIDPLLLQVIWLSLAFAIGLAFQFGTEQIVGFAERAMQASEVRPTGGEQELSSRIRLRSVVESFPLFIYTLFGGWMVRRGLQSIGLERALDRETINRLTSSAMDILVVSAIATLNLTAVATLLVPFCMLFTGAVIWCGICLLLISRWILPKKHWFELGLINYGMSTGTTATGFVLLRLVDPELESGAAEDYALAAPLSSPFIGGGMITVGLPLLVLERVPIFLTAPLMVALVMVLIGIGRRWNREAKSEV